MDWAVFPAPFRVFRPHFDAVPTAVLIDLKEQPAELHGREAGQQERVVSEIGIFHQLRRIAYPGRMP